MSAARPAPEEIVRAESPRRRVTRRGPARVCKEFKARTRLRRVREASKALFGRTAAQCEARALRALARARVAVPRLVSESTTGFGTRRLELEFVAGEPLVRLLGDRATRRAVLVRVGAELHRAHAAGWLHRDLHEGNVLVHAGRPVLIDWQRARRGARTEAARARDVARFEHAMWLHGVPCGDRMRFRRAALGLPPGRAAPGARGRVRAVGRAVDRRVRSFAAVRARRALRAEDGRAAVSIPGLRGLRPASISDAELEAALEAHAQGIAPRRCGGRPPLRVIEMQSRGLAARLLDGLRGAPARRAFRDAHARTLRGAPGRVPRAWIERRRCGLPVTSWLICEDA